MKKLFLSAAFAAAIVLGVNADEYRHISPITLQLIEFNLDTMRTATDGNLDLYLTHLASLQTDLEKQGKEIANEQKNLKSEKKLYDAQMSFLKNRQAQVKNAIKFYQSEVKNYDSQLKNLKKQYEMIQKMNDISNAAMQEQLAMLRQMEEDINAAKERSNNIISHLNEKEVKDIDKGYEVLSQYLIEINDKTTRLENLATRSKAELETVKGQIKNIQAQQKAAAGK